MESTLEGELGLTHAAGVATLTINRPRRGNSLALAHVVQMTALIENASTDRRVRAIVLTGSGDCFSAGTDLDDASGAVERAEAYLALYDAVSAARVPVIAMVNGHVYGGALGLVATCDLAVMAEEATWGLPEARMGMVPTTAALALVRKVSRAAAVEVMITGRRMTAAEALTMGLVNRVVPATELNGVVARCVSDIEACGPEAVSQCKDLVSRFGALDHATAARLVAEVTLAVTEGPEAAEGQAARREGRQPAWLAGPEHNTLSEGI